ncbi:MAG TPA: VanW family protein [Chitinophagales bacterium]|nr:VanW family protein [Chitinophagales bacterium]
MNIKRHIPSSFKLLIKLSLLNIKNTLSGKSKKMIAVNGTKKYLPVQYTITQKIMPNEYFDNKIKNLLLATEKINNLIIPSKRIFSFNKIVGNPSIKNGFKESRSIKDGKVIPEIGGGLCQLPWIMYHLCLQTDIKIIERHHHSKDIYDNNTRFAPLGSDATIVYGYKDFQIQNNTTSDICFYFSINHDLLSCSICSNQKLNNQDVAFTTKLSDNNQISVETFINNQLYKQDIYLR